MFEQLHKTRLQVLFQHCCRTMASAVLLLGLAACTGDMSDLRQYIETTKGKYQGRVDELPNFQPYQSYNYNGFDFRDPFQEPASQQPVEQAGSSGPTPDAERRKEPLEFFPLDSLKMVGTLEQKGEIWGLVRDPEGTIHRVQPGNHAGENYGEITKIGEDGISLLEIIPDGLGAWIEREVSLSIGEE